MLRRTNCFQISSSDIARNYIGRYARIVLNHDDANDVMQNVFVKAWNNLEQFQERSKIYTWLYRIAINESLDFLRRKRDLSLTIPTLAMG